jgi:hypothetical protein
MAFEETAMHLLEEGDQLTCDGGYFKGVVRWRTHLM